MKPRTKLQFEVIKNSKCIPNREREFLPWARKECLDHKGYATQKKVVCMDCGSSFSPELVVRKRAVCPTCHTKLKVEQTKKRTFNQRVCFADAEIYGEFQVVRNYELRSYHKAGEPARVSCWEILQHWILPDGKMETVARNHSVNWYYDTWNGDMEIRKEYKRWYYNADEGKYDVYPFKYHPSAQFKPMYARYGISHSLKELTFREALKIIPCNPIAETLLKAKQYSLLSAWTSKSWSIKQCWPSVKICIRNKYKVKDGVMWLDYIDLLGHFGKDLRNAKYVCPPNLKKSHDLLVKKKREEDRREELTRKREQALRDESCYREFIQRFADLDFVDKEIHITPLKNIEEFMVEGDALRHCVFTNEYFRKEDSLILSAKKGEERLETVEFDLREMKVVQCRGKHNGTTEYHDRILSIVNKNKRLIKERHLIKQSQEHYETV